MRGNCYVASEALYYLLGGKEAGWKPATVRVNGVVHWFLKHNNGMVLDITKGQFGITKPIYTAARGRGFLTKVPSKRAIRLMRDILWQEVEE